MTTALFVAPVDKAPGDGLFAGCLRLDEPKRPATDATLKLEGSPVLSSSPEAATVKCRSRWDCSS